MHAWAENSSPITLALSSPQHESSHLLNPGTVIDMSSSSSATGCSYRVQCAQEIPVFVEHGGLWRVGHIWNISGGVLGIINSYGYQRYSSWVTFFPPYIFRGERWSHPAGIMVVVINVNIENMLVHRWVCEFGFKLRGLELVHVAIKPRIGWPCGFDVLWAVSEYWVSTMRHGMLGKQHVFRRQPSWECPVACLWKTM